MAFHDVGYDAYCVLGDPDAPALWNWVAWERFRVALDPLIKAARGKPAVRSTQYLPDRAGAVKFGRIGWTEADHQKWTHGSPINQRESMSWGFLSAEVWAPAWMACQREGRPPDVFLSIADESLGGRSGGKEFSFNPVIVFAVESEIARREVPLVSAVVTSLWRLTSPKLVGYRQRPWGVSFGSTSFTSSIQDLVVSGLFKPGRRHGVGVGFHLLADEWEPVSEGGAAPRT
jgi:hypothetical protein